MSTSLLQLDQVIRRYAWDQLKKKSNFFRRVFLEEEDYDCEIDWSSLSIDHKLVKFSPKEKDGAIIETNWGKVTIGSRWVSLWSCDFENKADSKQSHTFRGSRDTTTWVDVDLTQCYTVDREVSVDVNIPPSFSKFRAGRDNSLSLNKIKGQVFKELLTWEVNSQVEVIPGWRARAQLLAREECQSMEFEIRSTFYNPKGYVPVKFVKRSDRSSGYLLNIDNFQDVFKLEEDGGFLKPEEKVCVQVLMETTIDTKGESRSASHPQIVTKGSLVCLSWSDQKVDIKTSPISVDETAYDADDDNTNSKVANKLAEKQFVVKSC